jgi:PAS domain-containing protein
VEVVLETLPLGVFVLDAGLAVVRANRAGAGALGETPAGRSFIALLPPHQSVGSGSGWPR